MKMSLGEKARLDISADYAYGELGTGGNHSGWEIPSR